MRNKCYEKPLKWILITTQKQVNRKCDSDIDQNPEYQNNEFSLYL